MNQFYVTTWKNSSIKGRVAGLVASASGLLQHNLNFVLERGLYFRRNKISFTSRAGSENQGRMYSDGEELILLRTIR